MFVATFMGSLCLWHRSFGLRPVVAKLVRTCLAPCYFFYIFKNQLWGEHRAFLADSKIVIFGHICYSADHWVLHVVIVEYSIYQNQYSTYFLM